jgi:hypothetical protein
VAVPGVIESMTGSRFVHDRLEELGWDALIADAAKVKGLAPLACKTDERSLTDTVEPGEQSRSVIPIRSSVSRASRRRSPGRISS